MGRITILFAVFSLAASCVSADTVTVDTTSELVDGDVSSVAALIADPGPDGRISLPEAVWAADNDQAPDTILFSIPVSDSGYNTATGQWEWKTADPFITVLRGYLTIDGSSQAFNQGDRNPDGPELRIDGSGTSSPFAFNLQSGSNTINDFHITGFVSGFSLEEAASNSLLNNVMEGNMQAVHLEAESNSNMIGPGNVIAGNGIGVRIEDGSHYNTITQNAIFSNRLPSALVGSENISIEGGSNGGIQAPAVRHFGGVIAGEAIPGSVVEIFSSPADGGENYLATAAADSRGRFGVIAAVPDRFVTATQTDAAGNTSGFSSPSPPFILVSNSGADDLPGNTVSVIDGISLSVAGTVDVGMLPEGISSVAGGAIVVNANSNSASVIDTYTISVSGTIPLPEKPIEIVSANQSALYIASSGPDPDNVPGTLSITGINNLDEISTVTIGRHPGAMAHDEAKGVVAVQNILDNNVSVVDLRSETVSRTIAAGDYPSDVYFGRDNLIYVTNIGNGRSDSVSVIDYFSGKTLASIFTGLGPVAIAGVSGSGQVAVVNSLSDTVTILNEANGRVVKDIAVGRMPSDIAVARDRYLFVTNFLSSVYESSGSVSVISAATLSIAATLRVGNFPNRIAVTSSSPGSWFGSGAEMAAYPSSVSRGDKIGLGYVVEPGILERADVLLGVELPDGRIFAWNAGFRGLRRFRSAGSAERIARNFRMSSPSSGTREFTIPQNAPAGTYRFAAGILRPGTSSLSQAAYSNEFRVTE